MTKIPIKFIDKSSAWDVNDEGNLLEFMDNKGGVLICIIENIRTKRIVVADRNSFVLNY